MTRFNAAFRRWFGRSVVRHADGRPLVVYHGTSSGDDFYVFHPGEGGGIFFTDDPDEARHFAEEVHRSFGKPRVVAAYLSIQNPYIWNVTREDHNHPDLFLNDERSLEAQMCRRARRRGHDGMVIRGLESEEDVQYVVFSPTQIKSVDNVGTWSREDPDIRRNPPLYKKPPEGQTGYRRPGEHCWFEYHCWEDDESEDATIWYRSHQKVTVLGLVEEGYGETPQDRADQGEPASYLVRFKDGVEWEVFEDEILLDSPKDFCKEDPPPMSRAPAWVKKGLKKPHTNRRES